MIRINKKGFTVVELLVVAAIIIVLSGMGLVSYSSANLRSRDAKRKSDLEQVRAALELYRSDNPTYPAASGGSPAARFNNMVSSLETADFLTNTTGLEDPKNTGVYVYRYAVPGSCSGYEVCATLENDSDPYYPNYCLCNP